MRAETLAKLYLTRRGDLDVFTLPESTRRVEYDLLVRVNGAGALDTPELGVEIEGIDQPLESSRWRLPLLRNLVQSRNHDAVRMTDQNLPICLFVFNIDTEDGLYLWLQEPHVDQNGHA